MLEQINSNPKETTAQWKLKLLLSAGLLKHVTIGYSYSDPVMLLSDCSGLLEMMEKPLADIKNIKIQKILENA